MVKEFRLIAEIINSSTNTVFFGGAGVSTECGIPDFRSQDGLYNQKNKYNHSPEEILSYTFFMNEPETFYSYVRDCLILEGIKPNKGHYALAELEAMGKLNAIITQNIDNLHQKAGSKKVYELHGTMSRYYCIKCKKKYDLNYILQTKNIPLCTCGGIIRPDITLYEEALKQEVLSISISHIKNADTLIVAGTSLLVYPAAGLLKYFNGNKMIIINKDKTPYDGFCDIVIREKFGISMENIMNELKYLL